VQFAKPACQQVFGFVVLICSAVLGGGLGAAPLGAKYI